MNPGPLPPKTTRFCSGGYYEDKILRKVGELGKVKHLYYVTSVPAEME